MRSPWQLVKSLTSRRKVEGGGEPTDEVVPMPDPHGQEVAQDNIPQAGPNAAAASISLFAADDNEPREHPNPPKAETSELDPVAQADTLLSEHVSDAASNLHDRPSPAASVPQATEPKPIANVSAGGRRKRPPRKVQEPNAVTETAVIKRTAKRPEAAKKTFLEEAIEQDGEINDLRSQLSAKLCEQNRQLRRMLDRYNK